MRLSVLATLASLLCLALLPPMAAAKKNKGARITVGPSGQFATIQEGVDAAVDGDQVTVQEGTYNESVVIAGRQNFVLAGARNNTNVIGAGGHAITVGPGGGLSTLVTQDDTQELPVGQGAPNSVCVDTGADGICDSTASGDDVQGVPLGQGFPDTFCVKAGADNTLDTAAGVNDDVVDAPALLITTGPDGICDTTADAADEQTIPVGNGAAGGTCVDSGPDGVCDTTAAGDDAQVVPLGQGRPFDQCVGRGPNGAFETTPAGDDDIRVFGPFGAFGEFISTGADGLCDTLALTGDDVVGAGLEKIDTGANGICETAAGTGETQVLPVGNGEPGTDCVTAGGDATLDTAAAAGDDVIDVAGSRITSGPDGVCDTTADPNDVQALPVGQGAPNSPCVTADNPLVRARNVKIQNLGVRAPDGFDGVHVERADFVEIASVLADGTLGGLAVPTGRIGVFVDFRSVKPVVKRSTAQFWSDAGFRIDGPGAQISSSVSTSNGGFGFFQEISGTGALLNGNTAGANGVAGFAIRGSVAILQRCTSQANLGDGYQLAGAGSILFQSSAIGNAVGVRAFGPGTRIRSSTISNSTDKGIVIEANPDPNFPEQVPVGSEVFSNVLQNNMNAAIEVNAFGVAIRRNQIGPRKLTGLGRQDVGVHLMNVAQGALLEDNKLQNNFDVDGDLCAPAGAVCDLVNEGMNNAGKNNQFTPGSTPPPGFN